MSILKKALSRRGDVVRKAQDLGLEGASRLAAQILREPLPAEGFASWQVETLKAFQARICRNDEPVPTPDELDSATITLNFVNKMPPGTRRKMACLLVLIEAGSFVVGPTRKRFTSLSGPEQDVYLRAWENSPVPPQRAIFHALKSVAVMGYWTQPATWGVMGYSLRNNPGAPDRMAEVSP